MKHRTLDELKCDAEVTPITRNDLRAQRRQRLEHLARELERRGGTVSLLSRTEYLPPAQRLALRADRTPLAFACQDPVLRRQGLAGDTLGHAMDFFHLSDAEAHHLFCDCHYVHPAMAETVAARARSVARKMTVGEWWARIRAAASAWRFSAS